ncbi:MAG: ABC transporter ATP-binding protein [Bauldia sp.]|nr:ABC transporter ATP-binding protein [Bauldia sp.]
MSFVALEDVRFAYGGTGAPAVDRLTMKIDRGAFAAVVGPSGCGKSTLMKLATGLQFPQGGAVLLGGEPVDRPVKIAGMAFQAPTLLAWRTTRENILLPLEIVQPHRRRMRRNRAEYRARADALLASVGLAGAGDKYPWELSGGMQMRAALCRALIHEPELLMLDEPFGALDAFTREELWCVIRDLHAQRRMTVVLVTHDLREAVFLADTIFVMSARPGRIVATHQNTLPRPRELDVTFTPGFSATVQDLRSHIVRARP